MTYKLVCFDVDGTLVKGHDGLVYWEYLHDIVFGPSFEEQNKKNIRQYLAGELDLIDWTNNDLQLLKDSGATKEQFIEAAKRSALIDGAREVIQALHNQGIKLAIISGSISMVFDVLFPEHPFDDMFINHVHFKDDLLDSWDINPHCHHKDVALKIICEQEGIPLSQVVFIGDGHNDIAAMREAGLGIAYKPDSAKVAQAADHTITDLREILVFFKPDPNALYKKYCPDENTRNILLTHSHLVTKKALEVARRVPELNPDLKFIEEAAMLHDIGICKTKFTHTNQQGAPYIQHGTLGKEILEKEGYPKHARVCERHTGVGLSLEDIQKQNLPLQHKDMQPQTIEEEIICFADCFFSKRPDILEKEKSVEEIEKDFARFGERHVKKFKEWCVKFKEKE